MSNEPKALTVNRLILYGIKVACAVIIVICSVFTLFTVGPAIETRLFPVVSTLRILSITADQDGQAVVDAEFTKLRDCEFVGISWYRNLAEGFERVPVILHRREGDTSSPNRPVGTQRAGPWVIGMPAAELRENSFAVLTHTCHPLWPTRTAFWP